MFSEGCRSEQLIIIIAHIIDVHIRAIYVVQKMVTFHLALLTLVYN